MKSNLRKLMAVLLTVALLWTTVIPAFAEDVLVPEEDVIFAEPVDEAFEEVGEDLGNGLTAGDEDEQELTYEGQEAADEVVEQPIEADPIEAADEASQDLPSTPLTEYTLELAGDVVNKAEADAANPDYQAVYTGKTINVEAKLTSKTEGVTEPNFVYRVVKLPTEDCPTFKKTAKDHPILPSTNPSQEQLQQYNAQLESYIQQTIREIQGYDGTGTEDDEYGIKNYDVVAPKDILKDGYSYYVIAYTDAVYKTVTEGDTTRQVIDVEPAVWGIIPFKITPAPITIKVNSLNTRKNYVLPRNELTFEVTGLIEGDTVDKVFVKTQAQRETDGTFKAAAEYYKANELLTIADVNDWTGDTEPKTHTVATADNNKDIQFIDAVLNNGSINLDKLVYYYTISTEQKPADLKGKLTVIAYEVSFNADADEQLNEDVDKQVSFKAAGYTDADIATAFGIKVEKVETTDGVETRSDVTSSFTFEFVEDEVKDVGTYHIKMKSEGVQSDEIIEPVEVIPQKVKLVFDDSIVNKTTNNLTKKYNGQAQEPEYTVIDADGNDISDKFQLTYTPATDGIAMYPATALTDKEIAEGKVRKPLGVGTYTVAARNVFEFTTTTDDQGKETKTQFRDDQYNYRLDGKYYVGEKDEDGAASVTFEIVEREIIVDGLKVVERPFDGTVNAVLDVSAVKYLDAEDGTTEITDEALKLSVAKSKAVFEDANAGTEKNVYYNLALDGTDLPYILVNTTQVKKIPAFSRSCH